MKFTKLATVALTTLAVSAPVVADLVFPSLSYRTGPYAAGGAPYADGYADYFTLLNERDGGIGGVLTAVPECETGYNTAKGVECYEATKGDGALAYQPLSTGITYQLIPKTMADDIPLMTQGYGRTSGANGKVFSHVFNFPANYWSGASRIINRIMEENGGTINDRNIALVYHNSGYGKEPIPTLEALATKHGFNLTLIPVDHPGQEQKSQWLQIRRERPDNIILYGWGVMNQVALKEAANIRYPMDQMFGIWWSGTENDALEGMGSHGYKAATFHNVGSDYPVYKDIQKFVVDAGLTAGDGSNVGTVLYNRGMYSAMLAAAGAANAQEIHGVKDITSGMMRDGLEALNVTNEFMAAAGMPKFGPEFSVSCSNHGGPGNVGIQQWDGNSREWKLVGDFEAPDMEVISALIKADSEAYAAENNITPRDC
ncbi:ABC transporter substrate-binding protein [Candidatus Njordibacter sp. Uisw_056]|jgi:branched-chain amino acid transport system substrate-binding protein|uniref:ABC transporter substrate-binding protein n=1 Tax=Candidatus Njordibacter sp. Uisw_056 TaxID=3230973 RepID=UPI003D4D8BEA|tara:strand:- start:484 stop:1767 length:1284 start_codon:yes stop_codon:yes gene_type:complete